MRNFVDDATDDEVVDFFMGHTVTILKAGIIFVVWCASLALCGFGIASLFYAVLISVMACFRSWRRLIQPATLVVFVAALIYATVMR
jgi:hypothetical protein